MEDLSNFQIKIIQNDNNQEAESDPPNEEWLEAKYKLWHSHHLQSQCPIWVSVYVPHVPVPIQPQQ